MTSHFSHFPDPFGTKIIAPSHQVELQPLKKPICMQWTSQFFRKLSHASGSSPERLANSRIWPPSKYQFTMSKMFPTKGIGAALASQICSSSQFVADFRTSTFRKLKSCRCMSMIPVKLVLPSLIEICMFDVFLWRKLMRAWEWHTSEKTTRVSFNGFPM